MCRFGGVDTTFRLCHKNCFMGIPIQEGVIDVNVLHIPFFVTAKVKIICVVEGFTGLRCRGNQHWESAGSP